MKLIYKVIFTLIVSMLLGRCLVSCKVVKEVTKEVTKYDSVAIKENKDLKRKYEELETAYQKDKQQWENTGIVFDTRPCPDSAKTVTKIIFDNGKLKSIEGNVKSLNQSLYEKTGELLYAHSVIDSLTMALERKDNRVSATRTITIKETKTKVKWPIWLFVLFFLGGIVLEYKFRPLKRILSFLNIVI